MLISKKWLKEFVDFDISTAELADALTLTGSNVEGIDYLASDIKNVVVGKILEILPHPNADKLVICKVNVGKEDIQIVTGAPNIEVGQKVAVALDGAILPGDMKIRKGKLRGELSEGMLCSFEELKLDRFGSIDDEVDGIIVLDEKLASGLSIDEALELKDDVIEFEITSNRPDCLSLIGMAKEAASTLDLEYKDVKVELSKSGGEAQNFVDVLVDNENLCKRYCARVVKDIVIEPSPRWLRRRLAASGVRPINNIVDITNYVMLELGQPMHAFDLDKVEGGTIIVRDAKKDEKLITLDDKKRILDESMLIIADKNKAIGIAGVMGGLNTEITKETRNIVLESAHFDGGSVRSTSKKLALRSEASSRFEKGVDIVNVEKAIDRAVQLIEELGAGSVVEGKLDVLNTSLSPKIVEAKWARINELLGLELTADEIARILNSLNLKTLVDKDIIKVTVPSFRLDIEGVADLAEEVARIYGYDNIPNTLMEGSVAKGYYTDEQNMVNEVKETLVALGLFEIVTYSFYSPEVYGRIGYSKEDYPDTVRIENPLGEDQSAMRTSMIPGLLEVLARNKNRSIDDYKVFEIGNIFIPKSLPLKELPDEISTLSIGGYGDNFDFFELKGKLTYLFNEFNIGDKIEFKSSNHPSFHPGKTAMILLDGEKLGYIGEIHPKVCENYEIDSSIVLSEINFSLFLEKASLDKSYSQLPRYPAVERDLAIIVSKDIQFSKLLKIIKEKGVPFLSDVELFDIYEGKQIPEGSRSLAFSLKYRDPDRTLTDQDINPVHDAIIEALEKDLSADLRR